MIRYEKEQQWWEASREGSTTTFSFGVLGEPGRQRTKTHRTLERAKKAVDEGMRMMMASGYQRVLGVAEASPTSPVATRLAQDPTDREALAVHADWLIEQGDPIGEWVARSLAGEDLTEEIAAREEQVLGLDPWQGTRKLCWRQGLVHELVLHEDHNGGDGGPVVQQLLGLPALALLWRLEVILRDAMAFTGVLSHPGLRELTVGRRGYDGTPTLDLPGIAERNPQLVELCVHGRCEPAGALPVSIRRLSVGILEYWEQVLLGIQHLDWLGLMPDQRVVERLVDAGVFARVDELWVQRHHRIVLEAIARGPGPRKLVVSRLLEPLVFRGVRVVEISHEASPAAVASLEAQGIEVTGAYTVSAAVPEPVLHARPPGLAVERLEFIDRSSQKFWEIGTDGVVIHTRFGALGTRGRWTQRVCASEAEATREAQRRLEKKLAKGYARVVIRDLMEPR